MEFASLTWNSIEIYDNLFLTMQFDKIIELLKDDLDVMDEFEKSKILSNAILFDSEQIQTMLENNNVSMFSFDAYVVCYKLYELKRFDKILHILKKYLNLFDLKSQSYMLANSIRFNCIEISTYLLEQNVKLESDVYEQVFTKLICDLDETKAINYISEYYELLEPTLKSKLLNCAIVNNAFNVQKFFMSNGIKITNVYGLCLELIENKKFEKTLEILKNYPNNIYKDDKSELLYLSILYESEQIENYLIQINVKLNFNKLNDICEKIIQSNKSDKFDKLTNIINKYILNETLAEKKRLLNITTNLNLLEFYKQQININ